MLYLHQQDALMRLRNGSILMGGVGSGKSRTALAYYYTKVCNGCLEPFTEPTNRVPLYIITTAKKRDSNEWNEELNVFNLCESSDVIIDSWNNIGKYSQIKHAFFIFDEQRVPGKGSWAKTFIKISKLNKWILLSATPGDTWMDYIPIMIANGYYRNRSDFIHQHVVYKQFAKFPIIDHYTNVDKLYAIRDYITVKMDFKRPTIAHDKYIHCDYDDRAYKQIMYDNWDFKNQKPFDNISATMSAARKLLNKDESRRNALKEILLDERCLYGAIIFYNFNYELSIIKQVCNEIGVEYTEWNGHTHEEPRLGIRGHVYLVQYTAGCEGWECTVTNTIIFYSQTYSYKVLAQAKGRIDRLNTPFTDLYYIHLISDAPLDKAIMRCLKRKERFNETEYMKRGDY